MIAIIDADSMVYAIAYNCDKHNISMLKHIHRETDRYVNAILGNTKATSYIGYLEGATPSFRYNVVDDYKGERPETPEFFKTFGSDIVKRLVDHWGFTMVYDNLESDDAVAITSTYYRKQNIPHIVAGTDKDLKQLPGDHYNYRFHKTSTITETEAERNLYYQVLAGDKIDNIKGCPGVGDKGASNLLKSAFQELEWVDGKKVVIAHKYYNLTLSEYIERLGTHEGINLFTRNFNLVYLLREHEGFKIPEPILVK